MSEAGPGGTSRWPWVLLYAPWAFGVVYSWLVLSTIAGSILAFLASFLHPELPFAIGIAWSRAIVASNLSRVTTAGLCHMRPGQAYVIVSNHQSHFDVPALWSRWPYPFRFVMKEELRHVPFLGWAANHLGHVFVDRRDRARSVASLRAARPLLDRGVSILFFAEGTRSRDGRLQPFKKGAFTLALEAGLPILPVSISGTHRILPGGQVGLLPGHARITIHPPVPTEGLGPDRRDALLREVRAVIATGLTPFERGEPEPSGGS